MQWEKKRSSMNETGVAGCWNVEECKQIYHPLQNKKTKYIKDLNISSEKTYPD